MMPYSKLHGFFYRVKNKIKKSRKRRSWDTVPAHEQTTYFAPGHQLYDPNLLGPSTLVPDCVGSGTLRDVLKIFDQLETDPYLEFVKSYYRKGLVEFGDNWVFADIATVLHGICKNVRVQNYLEIGVRRGRSMAVVASMAPKCHMVGFDMWIPNYAGVDNPGAEFVRQELGRIGFNGELALIDGDSKVTVPRYFLDNPKTYFDLVTVDGDHSIGGATRDLKNVIERIKVGGFLVFDDICSSEHPYLSSVWDRLVANNDRFVTYSFTETGLGVGFAIKKY